MSVHAIAEEILGASRIKSGTLRFWGDWFGRPYDNIHQIVGCTVEGKELVVKFDRGERLRVLEPQGAKISADEFRITDAAKVQWEWFSYGRPQAAGNLYFMEYVRAGGTISGSTNVDWYTHEFKTSPLANAVEIL